MRVYGMRTGIKVEVTAEDRNRLNAVMADRNSPQKHVWRAHVVLLTADGCGTAEIMRRSNLSKTAVWRWQERFMHEGVDLVAPSGTPVRAAADGVVVGARPNGRYGNWIRIDHAGKLATVYGHLAGFAPGIDAGTIVSRGEVSGYVGSTGRSTAPHLHFELLSDGKPVNPINHPETKRGVLRGPDLDRLRKQAIEAVAERDRETAAANTAESIAR